ncbi:MAG TPA: methylthioribulose 1-phosphate dehydratase [Pyrinomonadaceae bacterium]|nr:methylthioribulose 1-phosphate dehydratase [Pyrinomonadaceae bacterium]
MAKMKCPEEIAAHLVEISKGFYLRGWVSGTSGNFSAVVKRDPLVLAMSASGADKEILSPEQILLIDDQCNVISERAAKPSAESPLHTRLAREFGTGAVLHTHSVWSTTLSELEAAKGGVAIEGYEMLKGLTNVQTHEHREWLPIVENSQDMIALAEMVSRTLRNSPAAHGFLLRRHGLYTWGSDLDEAKRHVEILEFLLEATGRLRMMKQGEC